MFLYQEEAFTSSGESTISYLLCETEEVAKRMMGIRKKHLESEAMQEALKILGIKQHKFDVFEVTAVPGDHPNEFPGFTLVGVHA